MDKNSIVLTHDQAIAKDKILNWWLNQRHEKQCFILTGYAGTGKSFLLNYTIENELDLKEREVQFLAPTGKAATVLIQKGALNACTIHKLIYNIIEEEFVTEINGEKVTSKKQKFVKVHSLPSRIKLIVLDETSMVDEKVMKDLLSFGVPMICCGDDAQLPPVGKSTDMLKNPDAVLSEIVRQEEDNAIIKIATMARNKEKIPSGNYGDVIVVNRNSLTEEMYDKLLLEADQVLCGTNRMRAKMNHRIKKLKGLDPYAINENEKVICLLNNWEQTLDPDGEYFLVNGIIGNIISFEKVKGPEHLSRMKFKPDFIDEVTEDLIFDDTVFEENKFTYDFHQQIYVMHDGSIEIKAPFIPKKKEESRKEYQKRVAAYMKQKKRAVYSEMINFFDSAYCISVHKSQGSEFDKVLVIDESWCFEEPEKWLYTAITRAKKKLVILK